MRKWNMPAIPLSSRMMNMILSPELRGAAIILGILSVMTFCTTFLLETNYNYYDYGFASGLSLAISISSLMVLVSIL